MDDLFNLSKDQGIDTIEFLIAGRDRGSTRGFRIKSEGDLHIVITVA